jgi:hypothetical protein
MVGRENYMDPASAKITDKNQETFVSVAPGLGSVKMK